MYELILGLGCVAFVVFCSGIWSLLHPPKPQTKHSVSLPKFVGWIGCGGLIAAWVAVVLAARQGQLGAALVFALLSFLGIVLILAYRNCRIDYDRARFTVKTFWGRRHTYTYRNVTAIQGWNLDVKIFLGRRVVRVDQLAEGGREFTRLVRREYRRHNGCEIPVSYRGDLFHGNISNPREFLFWYLAIFLLLIGVIVGLAILSAPVHEDDLSWREITAAQVQEDQEDLWLVPVDDALHYRIVSYQQVLPEDFLTRFEENTVFRVGCLLNERNDPPYTDVKYLAGQDGTVFLTIEEAHDAMWGDGRKVQWLFVGLAVLWAVFSGLSIYVGRHPERFSRRVICLFFRPEYVRQIDKK